MTPEGFEQAAPHYAARLLGETARPLVEPSLTEDQYQVAVFAGRSLIDNADTYVVMVGEPDDPRKTMRPDMVTEVPMGDTHLVQHPSFKHQEGRSGWSITADTCTILLPSDQSAREGLGVRVRVHHGTTAHQVGKQRLQGQIRTLTPITAGRSTVQSEGNGGNVSQSA